MQQRNAAVVDMEAKLNDMKSKSEEYTDKVSCWLFFFFSAFSVQLIIFAMVISRALPRMAQTDRKCRFSKGTSLTPREK